jgi:hypothetical protein
MDIWSPTLGEGSFIFISKTGFKDEWDFICNIPKEFTNDIIKIDLLKFLNAKYIKIVNYEDALGVGYLDLSK